MRETLLASATRLSKGFAIANLPKITFGYQPEVRNPLGVSSWTRGFPPSDYSEFGFIGKFSNPVGNKLTLNYAILIPICRTNKSLLNIIGLN